MNIYLVLFVKVKMNGVDFYCVGDFAEFFFIHRQGKKQKLHLIRLFVEIEKVK